MVVLDPWPQIARSKALIRQSLLLLALPVHVPHPVIPGGSASARAQEREVSRGLADRLGAARHPSPDGR